MSERTGVPRSVSVALAGVVVALLAAGGWLLKEGDERADELAEAREQLQVLEAEERAGREALKAAAVFVGKVTTYSYKEGEHDFAWVEELNDPDVRARYEPVVADLQRTIVASRTTAEGRVVDSAPRVIDQSQVEVLAFVDQAITDRAGEVSVEQSSITVTMKRVDGEWRVEELRFLNALTPE